MNAEPAMSTVDGRRARRDQNRERVVDALLELYREGLLRPTVAEVAERSGVSHRSVFRYFDDLEELYRVAIERQEATIAHLWNVDRIGEGPLEDRVAHIVEKRLALYAAAAPVARVAHMRAPSEPVLLAHIREVTARAVAQIGEHFAPELAGLDEGTARAAAEAAASVLSIENMETLGYLRGLEPSEMAAAMTVALTGIFGTEGR